MALRFSPLANMTGPDGLIQQPVTPDYSILAKKLHEAQRALVAPDTANADRPGYQTQVNDLQRALVASKDQSRLDQLPPGPMPPPGDVTVIEKGAVQERPPSSFGTLATEDQIMQAFQRRQQQAAPPEMMVAEAPTPMVKPQAPKPQPTAVDMANMQGGAPAPAPQTAMAYQAPAQSTGGVSFAPNTEQRGISLGANAAMQKLEHSWGRPFTVTSAYRSPEHNAKVGGAKHSQHLHGNAFDISTDGWTEADKQAFVDQALAAGFNGIGVYPNSLHIDVGNRRAWGPSYGSESAPEWAIAKVNGAPATDQNWITGGESAQPSALAFNAEDGMQPSAGGPQDGLMRLLSAMRQPQAEPQGQYVPMEQPQAYTEVAQGSQPIVAPGSNVKPVSFSGDGAGAIRSPEQIDNTRQLAAALMSPGAQRIDHPLQGVAQVANAAAGAYGMYRADQQEQQRSNALAQALQGYYNGGNADALAAVAPNLYARVMEQRQSRQAAEQQAQQQRQASREDYVWKKGIDQQYAEPKLTDDQREYQQAVEQGYGGTLQEFIKEGRAPLVNMPPGETEYQKERGKNLAGRANAVEQSGNDAVSKLQKLNQIGALAGRVETGALAPQMAQIGAVAEYLGVSPETIGIDPNLPTNAQTFNALTRQLVMGSIGGEEGFPANNFSDADRSFVTSTVPSLENTPEANKIVLEAARRIENIKVERAQSWFDYRQKNGENASFDQWENEWRGYMRSNNFFGDLNDMVGGGQQQADGPTATNPQTGQKLILRNGQWVPIDG